MTQCKSCGGFCKKSGCERTNIKPASSTTRTDLIADLRLNHEYCPKEVILLAADMLEAGSRLEQERDQLAAALEATALREAELTGEVYMLQMELGDLPQAQADMLITIKTQRKVLEESRRELHACQAVIHLHGGFDPAYVTGAQSALKNIDKVLEVKS